MKRPEIELVELVHIAALARISLGAGIVARAQWSRVNPLRPSDEEWLLGASRAIVGGRMAASEVTLAFTRLMLALETGRTTARFPGERQVSMDSLRKDFARAVDKVLRFRWESGEGLDPDQRWLASEFRAAGGDSVLDPGELVKALREWGRTGTKTGNVRTVDAALPGDGLNSAKKVQENLRDFIRRVGAEGFERRVQVLKRKYEANLKRYEAELSEAFETHGGLVASMADTAVMDRSRRLALGTADLLGHRVLVARGTRSNPCGFCAMLASRGFVYMSERSAILTAVGKRYHPNCHCYPIMRVSTDVLPERNEYWHKMWPIVTKGYSGAQARNVWRRWVNAERAKVLGKSKNNKK